MERSERWCAGRAGEARRRVRREDEGAGLASQLVGQGQLRGGKRTPCACVQRLRGGVTQSRKRRDRGEPEPGPEPGSRSVGGRRQVASAPQTETTRCPSRRSGPPLVRNGSGRAEGRLAQGEWTGESQSPFGVLPADPPTETRAHPTAGAAAPGNMAFQAHSSFPGMGA